MEKRQKLLKRNIKLFYLLTFFEKSGFWVPVLYFLFVNGKGLSAEQALFLLGLIPLSQLIFEVPTGVIADKFSKKLSLTLAGVTKFFAMIGIVFLGNFYVLGAMIVLRGIGLSLVSGADRSLIYDSLRELGEEKKYKKVRNISRIITYFQISMTAFLGGLIGEANLGIPVAISGISYLGAGTTAMFFLEPKNHFSEDKESEIHSNYLVHTWYAFRQLFSYKGFMSGALLLALAGAMIEAQLTSAKETIAPLFEDLGFGLAMVGVGVSASYLMKSIGAASASKFETKYSETMEALVFIFLHVIGYSLVIISDNPYLAAVIFVFTFFNDAYINSNLDQAINEIIPSNKRSTILSLQALFKQLFSAVFLMLFGVLLSRYSSDAALGLVVAIGISSAVLLLVNEQIRKTK